jgi:hypothetical protein
MMCDNCEKPRVCPDDCGMYQDLEGDYEAKTDALVRKIESLKGDLELWKGVAKHHYTKMVEAKIALKAEKETSEFLRKEVYRKDMMVQRLK